MGVDCTLLLPHEVYGENWSSHGGRSYIGTELDLRRRREMWEPIAAVPTNDWNGQLWECSREYVGANDDYHESAITEDKYGTPLKWGRAKDFADAMRPFTEGPHEWPTRAAVAYLDALPDDYPVIPYWH